MLEPFVDTLIDLDDDGLCCGAGGAFSLFQPVLASQARDRKISVINEHRYDTVVSANPGCLIHLQQAGIKIQHPMEIVEKALAENTGA